MEINILQKVSFVPIVEKQQGDIMRSILFLLLFILLIIPVNANDDIDGTFEYDLDNDPPIFVSWENTDEVLPKDTGHTFYAVILDIDNTSSELIVDFVYSPNSFVNESKFTMNFILEDPEDIFRFEYDFPAQVEGYSIQYYYNVTDGTTEVNKTLGNPAHFTAQWGEPFPEGDGNPNLINYIPVGVDEDEEGIGELVRDASYLTIFINFGLIVGGGGWRIHSKRRAKAKKDGTIVTVVKRKWLGSPTGRFLDNIKDRDKGGSNK